MKTITGFVAAALLFAAPAMAADVKLDSDTDKEVYTLGLSVARNLTIFSLTEEEMKVFQAGLVDGLKGEKPKVDVETYGPKLQEFAKARATASADVERKAGEDFLKKAEAEKGAQKSASGLIYTEVAAGKGDPPAATSTVKVNYKGTLRDGTVFDSSYERKEPVTFAVNQVIPCWTEGLQKMKPGGKAKLVCPASIAYGDRGAPPMIKPGATLVFEVELLEVVKSAK